MKAMITPVKEAASSIGSASTAVGVFALISFIMSMLLYNRAYTAAPNWHPGMRSGETFIDAERRQNANLST